MSLFFKLPILEDQDKVREEFKQYCELCSGSLIKITNFEWVTPTHFSFLASPTDETLECGKFHIGSSISHWDAKTKFDLMMSTSDKIVSYMQMVSNILEKKKEKEELKAEILNELKFNQ
jgi:hypothetical protein